jgi:hypothetical protein
MKERAEGWLGQVRFDLVMSGYVEIVQVSFDRVSFGYDRPG